MLFSSVNNNVAVTKQILFSLTFSKSWVQISENTAGRGGSRAAPS